MRTRVRMLQLYNSHPGLIGGGANRLQLLPMFRLSTDGGQAEPIVLVRVIMTL